MRRPALNMACGLLALTVHVSVLAEMWVWVDERGTSHWAGHQVDERYQLFFKGPAPAQPVFVSPLATLGPAAVAAPVAPVAPLMGSRSSASMSRPRLLNLIESSSGYKRFLPLVQDVARQLGLDSNLMVALIAAESAFDPRAVSSKGAIGLMQLMPGTAQRYGVRPQPGVSLRDRLMHPETNLRAGAQFLRDLLLMYPGRLDLVLAAYNAGPGAVQRAGQRIPDYPETQNYVRVVTELMGHMRGPAAATIVASELTAAVPSPSSTGPAPSNIWLPRLAADAVDRGILLAPPGIPLQPGRP